MDNYYKANCAGLARRVEIFKGEFVKKRGIPAIAHASVSPGPTMGECGMELNGHYPQNQHNTTQDNVPMHYIYLVVNKNT